MANFLSRLGNLAASISPVGRIVRGGVNAARAAGRGDLWGAARSAGGAVLGAASPLAGQAMRARAQFGALTGGVKGAVGGPQQPTAPMGAPMKGQIQGGPGVQMGPPPAGMPGMAQAAPPPNMGQDVENARRQFMLSKIQRNPTGGY